MDITTAPTLLLAYKLKAQAISVWLQLNSMASSPTYILPFLAIASCTHFFASCISINPNRQQCLFIQPPNTTVCYLHVITQHGCYTQKPPPNTTVDHCGARKKSRMALGTQKGAKHNNLPKNLFWNTDYFLAFRNRNFTILERGDGQRCKLQSQHSLSYSKFI